ncbi:DNA-directed RNA polymerases I and III subunit RPAC1 [Gaertneriomyces sp. JEL0708]|nr:DNA-directed RNA polymerases I and III subunit RPAC1 [Gaertneriomyces sp. JEL0708]
MGSTSQESVDLIRSRVILYNDRVAHPSSIDYPHQFPGEDLAWDFEKFKQDFDIVISYAGKDELEFDMIGIDAAIANAFRRFLIGEVPTMAIEKCYFMQNTTLMHDEIMAQRLGLIPIFADPRQFDFRRGDADPPTDNNTIVFRLQVKCSTNPHAPPNAIDPTDKYINSSVYSSALVWEPQGDQAVRFRENPIKPVHNNILITKMRPGQEIDVELHCQKGIGKEHAKWSPVATASYRLLPDIQILKPITGDDAYKFQKCFPKGVIAVEKNAQGEMEAKVINPRKDTVSREALRHPEFEDKVRLTRVRDHFIFGIESVGILPPHTLFTEAAAKLVEKCQAIKFALTQVYI